MNTQVGVSEIGNVRTKNNKGSMENVDNVEDPPNQREANGNAGIQATQNNAVEKYLCCQHGSATVGPKTKGDHLRFPHYDPCFLSPVQLIPPYFISAC